MLKYTYPLIVQPQESQREIEQKLMRSSQDPSLIWSLLQPYQSLHAHLFQIKIRRCWCLKKLAKEVQDRGIKNG